MVAQCCWLPWASERQWRGCWTWSRRYKFHARRLPSLWDLISHCTACLGHFLLTRWCLASGTPLSGADICIHAFVLVFIYKYPNCVLGRSHHTLIFYFDIFQTQFSPNRFIMCQPSHFSFFLIRLFWFQFFGFLFRCGNICWALTLLPVTLLINGALHGSLFYSNKRSIKMLMSFQIAGPSSERNEIWIISQTTSFRKVVPWFFWEPK